MYKKQIVKLLKVIMHAIVNTMMGMILQNNYQIGVLKKPLSKVL